ncbi:hypothetical protein [Roseomonas genomospecies 6]|uniref:Uncharacterized protein n=1 Tax=Roseomonas genomospecies 6 TaxID=214106 RepID=A0A9W7KSX1_9PROT|nr:hypothetical protein [Roseomonas genomospecies 6]KAA0678107.1 hypothetical protein DS843_21225 [Roseomonas genomospecies 6]
MTISPVADAIEALADQIAQLAQSPGQQSPGQTDALADRLFLLAQQARPVEFQTGVRLSHRAEGLRGRAITKPFRPLDPGELNALCGGLRYFAATVRGRVQSTPVSPSLSAGNVLDFSAAAARRHRAAASTGGDAA